MLAAGESRWRAQTLRAIRGPGDSLPSGTDDKSRSEAAGVLERSKGPVALRPSSGCRDDEGDRGVQSLGGGERPIVLKFTGAAIDFDRIESRPCCRLLLARPSCCPSTTTAQYTVVFCGSNPN